MEYIPQNQKSFLSKKATAVVVPVAIPVSIPIVAPPLDKIALLEARCDMLEKTIEQLLHDFGNVLKTLQKPADNVIDNAAGAVDEDSSTATPTGDSSTATPTGDSSTATPTGDSSTATPTGDSSAATPTDDSLAAPLSRSQKKKLIRRLNQN